jgi:hypothetical protein
MKIITVLSVILAGLMTVSCTRTTPQSKPPETGPSEGEGFAVYLTALNVPVSQMEALSHVDPAAEPVISLDDIVSYTWETHEIELTAEGIEKLKQIAVPMSGTPFVVCVDRQPVYWGAFWSMLSSYYPAGMVTAYIHPYPSFGEDRRSIQLRFNVLSGTSPSGVPYGGTDPRPDSAIMDSLQRAGRLR